MREKPYHLMTEQEKIDFIELEINKEQRDIDAMKAELRELKRKR